MKITYLGHASLSIQVANKNIIVDPFITANDLAKNIDINSLKADYILVTHAHQDHILDVESIEKENNDIQLKDKLKKIPTEFTLFGISSQSNNQNMPENDWKLAIGLHKRPFSNLQFLKVAHENSKKNNSGIGIKDYRNFVYEFKKIQEDGKWKQKLTTGHQESS